MTINNQWSNRYTVIEVTGLDRPGLLYELTATLSKLSLNITSAHVATFGERVVDVFYVTDLLGAKIASPTREMAIKRSLLQLFAPAEQPLRLSAQPRRAAYEMERSISCSASSTQMNPDALTDRDRQIARRKADDTRFSPSTVSETMPCDRHVERIRRVIRGDRPQTRLRLAESCVKLPRRLDCCAFLAGR